MNTGGEKVFRLKDQRLARVLDRAATFHRDGELLLCLTALETAQSIVAPERESARKFLRSWQEAVEKEARGLPLAAAPSAWGSVAQELSHGARVREDYDACLEDLTAFSAGGKAVARRIGLAALGALAFFFGTAVLGHVLRGAWNQFDLDYRATQPAFFRRGIWLGVHVFATTVWAGAMLTYGLKWIRDSLNQAPLLAPKVRLRAVPVQGNAAENPRLN